MHVNTQKHHGHGVSMFAHVVGANCNSPLLQIAHTEGFCFQVLKIVKINTINKIKPISNEKIFIFAL